LNGCEGWWGGRGRGHRGRRSMQEHCSGRPGESGNRNIYVGFKTIPDSGAAAA